MERLIDSVGRLVEAALLGSVLDVTGRVVDRLDPAGAEARAALTDDRILAFVGSGIGLG